MAADRAVQGSTELTEADLKAAWRAIPKLKTGLTCALLFGLAYPLGLFLAGQLGPLAALLAAALLAGVLLAMVPLTLRVAARKTLQEAGAGATSYRLDAEAGLSVRSTAAQLQYGWPQLERFLDTPEAFVVQARATPFIVVPKRAFTPEDARQVRLLLAARITEIKATQGRGLRVGLTAFFALATMASIHHWWSFVQRQQ